MNKGEKENLFVHLLAINKRAVQNRTRLLFLSDLV